MLAYLTLVAYHDIFSIQLYMILCCRHLHPRGAPFYLRQFACAKVQRCQRKFCRCKCAMLSNLQALLLGVPVVIIVAEDVVPGVFVKVGVIFLNDFSVLAFISLPKILHASIGFYIVKDGSKFIRSQATSKHKSVVPSTTQCALCKLYRAS